MIGVTKTRIGWTITQRRRVTFNGVIRKVFEEVTWRNVNHRIVPTHKGPVGAFTPPVVLLPNRTFSARPGGTLSWTFLASANVACLTQPCWVTLGCPPNPAFIFCFLNGEPKRMDQFFQVLLSFSLPLLLPLHFMFKSAEKIPEPL